MPTEAQWEYAARCGTNKDPMLGGKVNWMDMDQSHTIQEVGQRQPNDWRFYDMLGTIKQMCFDVISTLGEWDDYQGFLRERYPYMREDVFLDWVVGYMEEEVDEDFDANVEWRVVKGGGDTCIAREKCHVKHIFNPNGFNASPMGFRVALRPITVSDTHDFLLKEEGINMLGN